MQRTFTSSGQDFPGAVRVSPRLEIADEDDLARIGGPGRVGGEEEVRGLGHGRPEVGAEPGGWCFFAREQGLDRAGAGPGIESGEGGQVGGEVEALVEKGKGDLGSAPVALGGLAGGLGAASRRPSRRIEALRSTRMTARVRVESSEGSRIDSRKGRLKAKARRSRARQRRASRRICSSLVRRVTRSGVFSRNMSEPNSTCSFGGRLLRCNRIGTARAAAPRR